MNIRAVYGSLAAALTVAILALALVVYMQRQDTRLQKILVRVICQAQVAGQESGHPAFVKLSVEYQDILDELGEECPQ